MYDAVLLRLSVCAAVMLSGCALIGYDLSSDSDSDPQAGETGNGSSGRGGAGADTDGGTSGASATGGGDGGGGGLPGWFGGGGGGQGGFGWPWPTAGRDGDAGVTLDAGSADAGDERLPDPCPELADGTPCDVNGFCKSEQTCFGGVCLGGVERDCSDLDQGCMHGVCVEENRQCMAKPVADGIPCGLGESCHEGVCRLDELCAPDQTCDLACTADECHISCDGANSCTIGCTLGADCDIGCQDAFNCETTCESATCDVDCRDATICDVTCSNSSCRIRCAGAVSCTEVVCGPGSSCEIECGGSDCDFALCATNDVQQCPGDFLVCNGECP